MIILKKSRYLLCFSEVNKSDSLVTGCIKPRTLACSICDGRYSEQSHRLQNYPIHNHNIIYLIEGDIETYKQDNFGRGQKIDRRTIYSAITMIQLYKGFSVFRTNCIAESAVWLVCMTDKMHREKKSDLYHVSGLNGNTIIDASGNVEAMPTTQPDNYSSVIKRAKKSNITTDNISEIMLSQIPGVSVNVAQTIMTEYKTIKNLIEKMEVVSYK